MLLELWTPLQVLVSSPVLFVSLSLYVFDEGVRGNDLRVSYCTEVYANYFFPVLVSF
jgi:uncharacterized membrane protein